MQCRYTNSKNKKCLMLLNGYIFILIHRCIDKKNWSWLLSTRTKKIILTKTALQNNTFSSKCPDSCNQQLWRLFPSLGKKDADGSRSGTFDFTSLMGNDKKLLLNHLPEKLHGVIRSNSASTVIKIWQVCRFIENDFLLGSCMQLYATSFMYICCVKELIYFNICFHILCLVY